MQHTISCHEECFDISLSVEGVCIINYYFYTSTNDFTIKNFSLSHILNISFARLTWRLASSFNFTYYQCFEGSKLTNYANQHRLELTRNDANFWRCGWWSLMIKQTRWNCFRQRLLLFHPAPPYISWLITHWPRWCNGKCMWLLCL